MDRLKYSVEEILGEKKKFFHHKRPLLNAESLYNKNHPTSALELYNRILKKIADPEIRDRIKQNLEIVSSQIQSDSSSSPKREAEQKKQKNKLFDPSKNLKDLENRARNLIQKNQGKNNLDPKSNTETKKSLNQPPENHSKSQSQAMTTDSDSGMNSPFLYEFNIGDAQTSSDSSIIENSTIESASIDSIETAQFSGEGQKPELPQATQPEGSSNFSGESNAERPTNENFSPISQDIPENQTPTGQEASPPPRSPQPSDGYAGEQSSGSPLMGDMDVDIDDILNQTGGEQPGSSQSSSQGMPGVFQNLNIYNPLNELLSNLYFSKDWQKYKNLPVRDRRTGKDRRKRQTKLPPGMKDRRTGKDRRVRDLFAERDHYLENWQTTKQQEQEENFPVNMFEPKNVGDLFPAAAISPYGGYVPPGGQDPGNSVYEPPSEPTEQDWQDLQQTPPPSSGPPAYPGAGQYPSYDPSIDAETRKSSATSEESIPEETEKGLLLINLPDPISADDYEISVLQGHFRQIDLPDPEDVLRQLEYDQVESERPEIEELPTPEIDILDGSLSEQSPYAEDSDEPSILDDEPGEGVEEVEEVQPKEPEAERMIHGVLELKPPEADDAPFLTLTYDFTKIPHSFKLSKNYSIMEYSYYKYKPLLTKAQEFARRKMLKNALNYYRVIKSQNIPPELKRMINRNITDITEFLEKYLMTGG